MDPKGTAGLPGGGRAGAGGVAGSGQDEGMRAQGNRWVWVGVVAMTQSTVFSREKPTRLERECKASWSRTEDLCGVLLRVVGCGQRRP